MEKISDTMEITREKSLNIMGQAYIDMKNNEAAAMMIVVREGRVSFASYDMSQAQAVSLMISLLASLLDDEEPTQTH